MLCMHNFEEKNNFSRNILYVNTKTVVYNKYIHGQCLTVYIILISSGN